MSVLYAAHQVAVVCLIVGPLTALFYGLARNASERNRP